MTFTWEAKAPSLVNYADGEDLLPANDIVPTHLGKALSAQYLGVGVAYLNRLVREGRIAIDHYRNEEDGYSRPCFAREELDRHQEGRWK